MCSRRQTCGNAESSSYKERDQRSMDVTCFALASSAETIPGLAQVTDHLGNARMVGRPIELYWESHLLALSVGDAHIDIVRRESRKTPDLRNFGSWSDGQVCGRLGTRSM